MANMHLVTGYLGQAHITSADQGAFNAAIVGEGGYVFNRGTKFAATVVSNNKITIDAGDLILQGRHARLTESIDLTINNGAQGKLRNDLIVARYAKDTSTGAETMNLVVVQGTPADSSPADPEINTGSIFNGANTVDFALYRVPLNGLNVQALVPLFSTVVYPLAEHKRIVVGSTPPESVTGLNAGDIYIFVQDS